MGKRCYLCGGRLSDGRCIDCGLDNLRIEKKTYRLNSSSLENWMDSEGPMANGDSGNARAARRLEVERKHTAKNEDLAKARVTREADLNRACAKGYGSTSGSGKKGSSGAYSNKGGRSKATNKGFVTAPGIKRGNDPANKAGMIKIIGVVLSLIIAVIGFVGKYALEHPYSSRVESVSQSVQPVDKFDPYEFVQRELSAEGDSYETILTPGEYLGGVHIPEGNYEVLLSDGSGSATVNDPENSIYLWQSIGKDAEYDEIDKWEDVRIYEGAVLEITGDLKVKLKTENARNDTMNPPVKNPLTEEILLKKGEQVVAGEDFPEGVYDVESAGGWSAIEYKIPLYTDFEDEELNYLKRSKWISESGYEATYRNLVIPKGTEVSSQDAAVILKPSEFIVSNDYDSYYDQYR